MAVGTGGGEGSSDPSRAAAGVFISYAREDEAVVKRLTNELRANGRDVWIDTDDIRGTEEWARAVDSGIESADAVAFVLSPAFAGSQQCRREVEHAVGNGKRLVPMLATEVDPADVAPELARLNWIIIGADDAAAITALEDALDTDLAWVRAHTDLLVRAVAWDARDEDRGLLLRGKPLSDAEQFLATAAGKEPPPAPIHARYVLASRRAATRRQRGTIAVVTTFLVVAVALAALAVVQRNRAVHESNLATSRELATSSIAVADNDLELSRLIAIEAMDKEQTPEAVAALRRTVMAPTVRVRRAITGVDPPVLALSPDGTRAALGGTAPGTENTIDVIDLESGRRVGPKLRGHRDPPGDAVFSPDGLRLASNAVDTRESPRWVTRLWNVATGRSRELQVGGIELAFSSDGESLLSTAIGAVTVFDADTGQRRVTLTGGPDGSSANRPQQAAFAPNGESVITWNFEASRSEIWNAHTGALTATLPHGSGIVDAEISSDGRRALTVGRDMVVRFWDTATGEPTGVPLTVPAGSNEDANDYVEAAAFTPENSDVVTTRTQHHLQVWHTRDGELQLDIPNRSNFYIEHGPGPLAPYLVTNAGVRDWVHDRIVASVPMALALLHEDGRFEAVEQLERSISVWTGQTESRLLDFDHAAVDVSFSRGRVAIIYADGTAEVRRLTDGGMIAELPFTGDPASGQPLRIELAPNGRTVALNRGDVTETWDLQKRTHRTLDPSIVTIYNFSADSRRLLVLKAGDFQALDVRTGSGVGHPVVNGTEAFEAELAPDGKSIIMANVDHELETWSLASGKRVGTPLLGQQSTAIDVEVSPDGTRVASGDDDGVVNVWDLENRRRVTTIRGHEGAVVQVGFSPNGRFLTTRSTDGTLRVWDASNGTPVAVWTGFTADPDVGLGFGESGNDLVRADDGYAYRIPCAACAEPDQLLARAKAAVRRTLTPAERRQYLHEDE